MSLLSEANNVHDSPVEVRVHVCRLLSLMAWATSLTASVMLEKAWINLIVIEGSHLPLPCSRCSRGIMPIVWTIDCDDVTSRVSGPSSGEGVPRGSLEPMENLLVAKP